VLNLYLQLNTKAPCYSTILLWTKKLGCYQLQKPLNKNSNWVLIIDESIQFGHEKLLLIYGIEEDKIDFSKALNLRDLTTLFLSSSTSWTNKEIFAEIKKIKKKIGPISYVVADEGGSIKKALRLSEIVHIYDINHKLALLLKKIYNNDKKFCELLKKLAKMKTALVCSNVSHILPPNLRPKSRFMNLDIISDWGIKILNYLSEKKSNEVEYKHLIWVKKYKSLILELAEINSVLKQIKTLLKINGVSKVTEEKVFEILKNIKINNTKTQYLKNKIIELIEEYMNSLPNTNIILCSSDIIESSFGKFKNYIKGNQMTGITNLSLCLSAFTSNLEVKEIEKALEKVKVKDVQNWSKKNITESNISKRKRFFKNRGKNIA
jgi:hypothetical protein